MGKGHELATISVDTCCDGSANSEDHVVTKIFPSVRRAPYANVFRKTQILTKAVDTAHPLFPEFSR